MKDPKLKPLSGAETDLNCYLLCLPQLLIFQLEEKNKQNCRIVPRTEAHFFPPWLAFPPSVLSARLCFASSSFAKIQLETAEDLKPPTFLIQTMYCD